LIQDVSTAPPESAAVVEFWREAGPKRWSHRNALLGRASTAEEEQFIAEGNFSG
jgi:uncharacterized protein (DUF924 family)